MDGIAVASALSNASGTLVTTITTGYSTGDQEYWYSSSKSVSQIIAAYNAGKTCYAIYDNNIYYLTKVSGTTVTFIRHSVSSSVSIKTEILTLT